MKHRILFIIACAGFLSLANPSFADSSLTIKPVLPVTCHDGLSHRRLNAVTGVQVFEQGNQVVVAFKAYMVDCHTEAGQVIWHFYGPLHEGRCDLSVRTYGGVRMQKSIVPLGAQDPYKETAVCGVAVLFDKRSLKPGVSNDYLYVYRYDGLGEYQWNINVRVDSETGKTIPTISQLR